MQTNSTSPRLVTRFLIFVLVLGSAFLDYWAYSREYHNNPAIYSDVLNGTASAPNQYRVLIIRLAYWIQIHCHVGLRHAMVLLDFLGALFAVWLLLLLLERSRAYRDASLLGQWLLSAVYLAWTAFALAWLIWYQRPETLPSAAFIAGMLAVLCYKPQSAARYVLLTTATLLLAALQAFTRADLAVGVYLGVLIIALSPLGKSLPAGRAAQATLSAAAVVLAGSVQWYLMHIAYPGRSYAPGTPVLQLALNLKEHSRIVPFFCFCAPLFLVALGLRRSWRSIETPHLALLAGFCVYLPLWLAIGKMDEVRITMPLMLALGPLAAMVTLHVATARTTAPSAS